MSRRRGTTPQRELLDWYARVGRDLPWRRTRDPYRILVSEIMLQQTQVERVLPYYQRFLATYPDAASLAMADEDGLHRIWKGLGYPSRATRLRDACAMVVGELGGRWPTTPDGLQALPGIGPYTAGAVACFAFAAAVPVVDTNVARVYVRRDGLPSPPPRAALWAHAAAAVDPDEPIAYTNALMDLGATVCTARKPDCAACPWAGRCAARGNAERHAGTGNPLKVAVKRKTYGVAISDRSKPRIPVVLALVHDDMGRYLVTRRPGHVHLGGYWELPGGKRERGEDVRVALARELREETGLELLSARPFVKVNHDYGDRYLQLDVYRCRVFDPSVAEPLASDELRWVDPGALLALEFPPANGPILERFRDYHRLGGS